MVVFSCTKTLTPPIGVLLSVHGNGARRSGARRKQDDPMRMSAKSLSKILDTLSCAMEAGDDRDAVFLLSTVCTEERLYAIMATLRALMGGMQVESLEFMTLKGLVDWNK